ncbi:MAG: hypothetical protein GY854_33345 [Deltaproteobacteria bacterium]|nr:hypothetical protein [Deltaproteobacteria bacterium]
MTAKKYNKWTLTILLVACAMLLWTPCVLAQEDATTESDEQSETSDSAEVEEGIETSSESESAAETEDPIVPVSDETSENKDATETEEDKTSSASESASKEAPSTNRRRTYESQPIYHDGFFFRITLGVGFGLYSGSGRAAPKPGLRALRDPVHKSLLIDGILSMGGYVAKNWALHGDMAYDGMPIKKDDPTSQEFGHFSAGLGATHYFMPWNLYLTASVRWARILLRLEEAETCWFSEEFHTYDGIGGWLTFGKEWMGKRTGFGLGLGVNYIRSLSEKQTFDQLGVMLLLTLTPN